MGKSSASINLLQRKQTKADVFLDWALTTGRFIIIFTETIALLAFAYRFTLDSKIIDYHDKIKQKQELITLYQDNEAKFRILHAKLAVLSTLETQSPIVPSYTSKIVSLATGRVVMQNLNVTASDAQITATTTSVSLLNSFVTSLKQDPNISSVSVDQVESDSQTGNINMSINVLFSTKKGVNHAS